MFIREKVKIGITKLTRRLFYQIVFWNASFIFFVIISGNKTLFDLTQSIINISSIYVNTIFLGTCTGLLFAILDTVFSDRIMRLSPIRPTLFTRSLLYFSLAFIIIIILTTPRPHELLKSTDLSVIKRLLSTLNNDLIKFMAYFYLSCIFNHAFKEIYAKIGLGNFFEWFFGGINKPKEDERVFMFLDMKSSTTIAENLKHHKFSRLVQDVFNDMAVVDNYHGEIYQYLGDGAIISWPVHSGINNNNCIKAFFAFTRVIERRTRYYNRRYGLTPTFKAGLHVGKIMVLQVGSIKRDISYNGDTINTSARIESMCNELKHDLLISGILYETLENRNEFNFKDVGTIKLKGKQKGVLIYGVKLKTRKR
ncbi:MAG: adenylate/guanylate cyclase domain-containing protein [Marinilabiliaceae bacterium]|nr:adenylate/guanylate cyclase domain-containing protein [Marinilabiliaceae bacterium]